MWLNYFTLRGVELRIIAGKYKGHPLVDFKATHIRPTTDRVKETMFNILMNYIEDSRVLDLFSGTGSLGLEAISRGAVSTVFVEKNHKSIMILEKNIEKLRLTEEYSIRNQDVFGYLKQYQGEVFNVVMADPPFTEKIAHEVALAVTKSKVLGPDSIFLIESSRHERIDEAYDDWFCWKKREFGDKNLSIFLKKESRDNQE